MKRNIITAMVIIPAVFFLAGLGQVVQAIEPVTKTTKITKVRKVENLVQIADNVIILFDSSGSMGEPFGDSGMTKIQAAKQVLKERADFLPDAVPDLNVGLYTYSYSYTPADTTATNRENSTFYGIQPFNKAKYQQALEQLPDKASGPTLMVNAIRRLEPLLENVSGRSVVFIFTDGTHGDKGASESPLVLAQKLAQKHDVNFQIISTTNSATHVALMEAVASINESSRVHTFENLLGRPEVFTGAVFALEESYVTSAKIQNQIVGFKLDHVLFGFDKADIEIEFTDELKAAGEILQEKPDSYLVLSGHTDSTGSDEYNLALSHQRTEIVATYMAEEFQIEPSRISTFWYGKAAPVASNATAEGRQQNRRVVGFVATAE